MYVVYKNKTRPKGIRSSDKSIESRRYETYSRYDELVIKVDGEYLQLTMIVSQKQNIVLTV